MPWSLPWAQGGRQFESGRPDQLISFQRLVSGPASQITIARTCTRFSGRAASPLIKLDLWIGRSSQINRSELGHLHFYLNFVGYHSTRRMCSIRLASTEAHEAPGGSRLTIRFRQRVIKVT